GGGADGAWRQGVGVHPGIYSLPGLATFAPGQTIPPALSAGRDCREESRRSGPGPGPGPALRPRAPEFPVSASKKFEGTATPGRGPASLLRGGDPGPAAPDPP